MVRSLPPTSFARFCTATLGVAPHVVRADLERWLAEDCGAGCVTLFSAHWPENHVPFRIVAKSAFVLCGLELMAEIFRMSSDGQAELASATSDGQRMSPGQVLLSGRAHAGAVLLGERVALNLASRLSGISTKTCAVADALKNASAAPPILLETRKTTPGLRLYEKYATRLGGARNHRHGLDGGAMLKENHLRCLGGLAEALATLKARVPVLTKIEVEVTSLAEFHLALRAGADVIMLDNFALPDARTAVAARDAAGASAKIEISGNLDRWDPAELAALGVDYASMGALIHQAQSCDMSLLVGSDAGA